MTAVANHSSDSHHALSAFCASGSDYTINIHRLIYSFFFFFGLVFIEFFFFNLFIYSLLVTLCPKCHDYPHFIGEEIDNQEGSETCPWVISARAN